MTDVFAEAAQQSSVTQVGPGSHPVTLATEFIPSGNAADMDDPFATSSQVSGGGAQWDPRVPYEEIVGRLVVFVPKSYREDAPNPFPGQEGKLREEFRADLYVLDGGPFEYEYNDRDPQDQTKKIVKLAKVEEIPFLAREQSVSQGSLVGKLKGVLGLPRSGAGTLTFPTVSRLYMGVLAYAPYSTAAKKGATIDSITAEVEQWIAGGRKRTRPDFTWTLDDRPHVLTPERRAIAGAWWNEFRKSL